MHEDDRGPDNEVLIDQLTYDPINDKGTYGETMLYRIVDGLIALIFTGTEG